MNVLILLYTNAPEIYQRNRSKIKEESERRRSRDQDEEFGVKKEEAER